MANVRACLVSVTDLSGVTHTVEVSASSLYEAAALGYTAIRRLDFAQQLPVGLCTITVKILEVAAEYTLKYIDLEKWVKQGGRTPADITQRTKVRQILGL